MTPHQTTPTGEALAAVQVLLADLAANGVTDVCATTPYHWETSLTRSTPPSKTSPQAAPTHKPQQAEPTNRTIHPRSARPAPEAKKAAKPQPQPQPAKIELPPLEIKDILWHTGTEQHRTFHIFTGATAEQKGTFPFPQAEHELLANMLKSLQISLEETATSAIATTTEDGMPHALERLMEQRAKIMTDMPTQANIPLLVFGQVAARLYTNQPDASLTNLREEAQAGKLDTYNNGHPVIITYHPRTLLKQPALKRLVWQDFCAYLNRVEAN